MALSKIKSDSIDSINASKITTGTVDNARITLDAAEVPDLDAAKITTGDIALARLGNAPATDLTPVRQDIAMLALYNAVSDNRVAYNLPFSFVDQFEDDTGVTTQTDVDNVSEYFASIYTSYTVTTPASASDWTGNTGSFAFASGSVDVSTGDNAIYSNWSSGTGDYTVQFTSTTQTGMGFGMFDASETGTHADTDQQGLQNMTNSYHWHDGYYGPGTQLQKGGSTDTGGTITEPTDPTVVKFQRISGSIGYYNDGSLIHTFTGTNNNSMKLSIGSDGRTVGDLDSMTFSIPSTTTNATGTLISDTQTSSVATTKMSGVILYKDNAGTATLGTDLVISLSANGGTNYTEAASYGAVTPLFSTGIKMVRLGETTVTSGTAPVIKAVWANQAASSKETQLHGWAMNY